MSEVISFRLDKANPREAQALEVLKAWNERGFSVRFILTKALLELEHPGSDLDMSQGDRDLGLVLDQIGQLLEILRAGETNTPIRRDPNKEPAFLKEDFIASIKQSVKPGIKLR